MNAALFSARIIEVMLRCSLSIVYAWFGGLKLFDTSPAHELVVATLPVFDPTATVLLLGWWEVLLAIMFLVPRLTHFTLSIFAVHMAGTFLPLFTVPETTWLSAPFVLSLVGQYIIKNLVFVAAGAALYHVHGICRKP
jgi:uncharacterized membrane protein YkgB